MLQLEAFERGVVIEAKFRKPLRRIDFDGHGNPRAQQQAIGRLFDDHLPRRRDAKPITQLLGKRERASLVDGDYFRREFFLSHFQDFSKRLIETIMPGIQTRKHQIVCEVI